MDRTRKVYQLKLKQICNEIDITTESDVDAVDIDAGDGHGDVNDHV